MARAGAATRDHSAVADLLTPSAVRAVLRAHGLEPSRALGQHFLADANTARRIARVAEVRPGDRVLEIGPGIGSLTLALVAAGARVVAVEIDRHVVPALRDVLATAGVTGDVAIVEGDALHTDLGAHLAGDGWALVANLPYNVATPVLLRVLDHVPAVDRALVMVQKEVAERLAAVPGTRAYGYPSLRVAYHGNARLAGTVPPTVFIPQPGVESALVALRRHGQPPVDADPTRLFGLARAGFAQRRKTLRRALVPVLGERTTAVLERAGVDGRARAEQLGLGEWAAITDAAA